MPSAVSTAEVSGSREYPWGTGPASTSHLPSASRQLVHGPVIPSAWLRWITWWIVSASTETLVPWTERREIKETPSVIAEIDSLLDYLQRSGISLINQDEIHGYLLQFPDLIDVLSEVVHIACEGLPEAHLSLELYHDPESEDEHLVLYARFREYDNTTMERIRDIRAKYRPLLVGKEGWIILTTDFQPPEEN